MQHKLSGCDVHRVIVGRGGVRTLGGACRKVTLCMQPGRKIISQMYLTQP